MSRHRSPMAALVAASLCAALAPVQAHGQAQVGGGVSRPPGQAKEEQAKKKQAKQEQAKQEQRNEQAMTALREMSDALASATTLQFKVRSLLPTKLASGDWVTLVGAGSVQREGKQRLFVETGGDLFPFRFYVDGRTVTAFAPKEKIYAQKDAPGTIDEVLEQAATRGEATFVFADVVSSDPFAAMTRGLRRADVVGTSTVDGVETRHLAAQGKDLDWEIWIGTKDRLPRMVTLTDTTDARRPTHTVMFSDWTRNVALPGDAFTFTPPPGATKVPFRDPSQQKGVGRRVAPTPAQ